MAMAGRGDFIGHLVPVTQEQARAAMLTVVEVEMDRCENKEEAYDRIDTICRALFGNEFLEDNGFVKELKLDE